jgi:hypothetical protein
MKLYNPFRLHIVQFADGSYAVRKMIFFRLSFSWLYLDSNSKHWERRAFSYTKHKAYEDAFMAMAKRNAQDEETKRRDKAYALSKKVTKVIA